MTYTGALPKTMFLDQLIANTRRELFEECDYLVEAQKQERMRALLRGDFRYFVPAVV
jgi:aarF domain-containing kinase